MKRRDFLKAIGGATAVWPIGAQAQQPTKVHRVAFIATNSPVSQLAGADPINPGARGLVQGMRALGYVEGKNLAFEWRSAEGRFERFADIIRELLSLNVDVIVTITNPMTRVAKDLTRTVPIVMISADPVEEGLVQSSLGRVETSLVSP